MTTELLPVPEEHILDVIKVIRAGLDSVEDQVDPEVAEQLKVWCDQEEDYLKGSG